MKTIEEVEMVQITRAKVYDNHADAAQAIRDLEAAGFSHDEISIVRGSSGGTNDVDDTVAETSAGTGASVGTLVGGGAGLLAGIGMLAIPGVGPIVAAGWLVAALTGAGAGAAAGGLLGTLVSSGIDETDANVHAEAVRRGGSLVTVRAEEARLSRADAILAQHRPVDTAVRGDDYRKSGWTNYTDDATGLSSAPDGTPGNPRGTMAGRAVDQSLGTNISGAHPENTEGSTRNPPGTAATRAVDDVAGTNVSGARPQNRDGTPGNPPGTAASRGLAESDVRNPNSIRSGQASPRADDDGSILPSGPDGTPGNPRGSELSRGIDQVAGTNISGAHPENEKPGSR